MSTKDKKQLWIKEIVQLPIYINITKSLPKSSKDVQIFVKVNDNE